MTTQIKLYNNDCLTVLKELKDNSVDSIVTDPPYGLSFMGKKWDYDVPSTEIWKECLRVLKPGGHLLSFAGSRTYHRMAVRIEDAGFEIRDQIMWIYGSGFPKSHNIGKAIEKQSGNVKVIGKKKGAGSTGKSYISNKEEYVDGEKGVFKKEYDEIEIKNQYAGWGTALKPAHEPIVMARKPFKGTVAENVLQHGTGAINIDGCRVDLDGTENLNTIQSGRIYGDGIKYGTAVNNLPTPMYKSNGRWPANVIHDGSDEVLEGFPTNVKGAVGMKRVAGQKQIFNIKGQTEPQRFDGAIQDSGSAARFFYCPKSSKKDRNEGCEQLEEKNATQRLNASPSRIQNGVVTGPRSPQTKYNNNHPTVKPTDLMAYLIRLVTPKNGITLDPFMGSGSTGKAAVREKVGFIGIERETDYYEIAQSRIKHEQDKNKHHLDNFVGQP
jgi:site-specific DNA-methyltransferase (adenine-specific)